MPVSRRTFLSTAGSSAALGSLGIVVAAAGVPGSAGAEEISAPVSSFFPTQEPDLVREMVTVAHFDLARVRQLLTRRPSLARAAWDWGFGDWETALGAASHMGNRPIAEILLANGARPDLFSAAMLGQIEVVRATVAARPGVQATRGPHGITLLAHARAGGDGAQPVVHLLESLGGADPVLALQPLAPQDLLALLGRYRFGAQPRDHFIVERYQAGLGLRRAETMGRPLSHLGGRIFSPAGAEAVRIRFTAESPALALSIDDPEQVVTARRE